MRDAFASELESIAAADDRVVLLSGDIGNRMFNSFRSRWPTRFYNCGVAESNMMSVAAGMGLCGLRPVVYTIVPFVTTRCLEQIRVDVCYHRSPVTIVGVGGGLSYAGLGATHHSCEDIAFLRTLPEMTVVCPGDSLEVRAAIRAAISSGRPAYVRLGKKGEPKVHSEPPDFAIGKGIVLRTGTDVCLVSTGNMLPSALAAADDLSRKGLSVGVVSMHTVKPIDEQLLHRAFREYQLVASLEEHSVLGGLGGTIAEWLAEQDGLQAKLLRIGTADRFFHLGGSEEFARRELGLDAQSVGKRILETWQNRPELRESR